MLVAYRHGRHLPAGADLVLALLSTRDWGME